MSVIAARFDPMQAPQRGTFPTTLINRCSGVWIINDSPAELTITNQQQGLTRIVPPGWVRSIRFAQAPITLDWQTTDSLQTQGASLISKCTVEAYDENEWPGDINQALPVRVSNVGNTVQTGTNVGQVTNIIYDQSAINGEPAGTVTSEAAAGSGAGTVDVTDKNATGGKRVFTMKTGTASIGADGAITAPAFHGNADSATTATTATNASNIGANADLNNPTVNAGNLNLDNGTATSPAAIFNDPTHTSRAYWQLVNELMTLFTTYRGGTNNQIFQVRLSDGALFMGAVLQVPQLSFAGGVYGGTLSGVSYFSGSGSGTFTHGLNSTPRWIGITTTQPSSTETVGVDSIGPTTCHVNAPNSWPWIGVALA